MKDLKKPTVTDVDFNYCANTNVEISTKVTLQINGNDIIDWLNKCCDPVLLRYISKYAKDTADMMENAF